MTKTIEVSDEVYEKIKDQIGEEQVKEIGSLDELVGEKYLFQCARYFYYGKVANVTPNYIVLKDAGVVFDVGDYGASKPSDIQNVPQKTLYIMRQSIESFFKTKW